MSKDWFERKVGIELFRRCDPDQNKGEIFEVWEIRWDNLRFWEIENPYNQLQRKQSLPSATLNTNELRENIWNKIKEKLDDGWSYSYENLPKLKPHYFVEQGVSDNDDLIYVVFSSEEGSKEVVATFNAYFPESFDYAKKLKDDLNKSLEK